MSADRYIDASDMAVAWARAVAWTYARGGEAGPLIVSVTGFKEQAIPMNAKITSALEAVLSDTGKQSVETVAGTIFPWSMWNPGAPRAQLFDRYIALAPRFRRASRKNQRGIYFERLVTGGRRGAENQLDFALGAYGKGKRRGILQLGVYDPAKDQSGGARQGFPCLQHVTFAPVEGGLCVNAFYATQYLIERGLGNYLGLARLGLFAAHELGLPLTRMTCYAGIALCELPRRRVAGVLEALRNAEGGP